MATTFLLHPCRVYAIAIQANDALTILSMMLVFVYGIRAVAVAPKNTSRHVPSLRELDEELKYSVPSASDGLDMSLLTDTLVPPEMVRIP